MTAQSGLVILVSVCVCVCVFIKLHITAQSGPVVLVILCHSHWSSQGGINDTGTHYKNLLSGATKRGHTLSTLCVCSCVCMCSSFFRTRGTRHDRKLTRRVHVGHDFRLNQIEHFSEAVEHFQERIHFSLRDPGVVLADTNLIQKPLRVRFHRWKGARKVRQIHDRRKKCGLWYVPVPAATERDRGRGAQIDIPALSSHRLVFFPPRIRTKVCTEERSTPIIRDVDTQNIRTYILVECYKIHK